MDTISIIIPVLDPGDTLVKVLDSLTTQTKLPDEVILIKFAFLGNSGIF